MGTPAKDPRNGKYRYRITYQGRRVFCPLNTTDRREAEHLAYSIDRTIQDLSKGLKTVPEGIDVIDWICSGGTIAPKPPERHTLGQLIASYQENLPRNAKAENTLRTEQTHFKHLVSHFGSRCALTSLDSEAVNKYVKTRIDRDPETISKELATLNLLWSYATRMKWVNALSPTKGVKLPKKPQKERFRTLTEIQEEMLHTDESNHSDLWECCFLDKDEMSEFITHVKSLKKPAYLAPMILMAVFTGARRSEIMRSQKRDWDIARELVTIREKKRVHTLSESYRQVPIHPQLREAIEPILQNLHASDYVFSDRRSSEIKPIRAAKLWRMSFRDTKWASIKGWHVLRHSFASNLAVAGTPESVIDKLMGHQTEQQRARYRHLFPSERSSAIASLGY